MALPLAGAKIKAADLASIFPLGVDAWVPFTPTVTQTATITKSSDCGYIRAGRWIVARYGLSLTSAGTANSIVQVTLPVAGRSGGSLDAIGQFVYFDTGTAVHSGTVVYGSTASVVRFRAQGVFQSPVLGETAGTPVAAVTVASGDYLGFSVMYEAAS